MLIYASQSLLGVGRSRYHQVPVLSHFSCVCLCATPWTACSPPGSSVHGILQARILEWAAISFSRGSSQPWDRTCVSYISCVGRRALYHQHHPGSPRNPFLGNSNCYSLCPRKIFLKIRPPDQSCATQKDPNQSPSSEGTTSSSTRDLHKIDGVLLSATDQQQACSCTSKGSQL